MVNLGTPDGTDYWNMRRYLKEFLSDRRVIESPPKWLWQLILFFFILTTRPQKSGAAYRKIWNNKLGESPLRTITRAQAKETSKLLKNKNILISWGMRYGSPSIKNELEKLIQSGCNRLILLPLYPQYCAATTATVCDKTFDALKSIRWQPSLRVVPPYYDHPAYIEALAKTLAKDLKKLKKKPDVLITSFHGIPKDYFTKGDPYHCHCAKTKRLLEQELKNILGQSCPPLQLTFQSRFGPAEWLQPYTDKTLEELPKKGMKNVAICTPGFAADCLETLEEIAMEGEEIFMENGGETYTYLPCLNDTKEGVKLLETLVKENLF